MRDSIDRLRARLPQAPDYPEPIQITQLTREGSPWPGTPDGGKGFIDLGALDGANVPSGALVTRRDGTVPRCRLDAQDAAAFRAK
jgi:hypothetical protein